MKWWLLAAKQGDANAQYNLGICYATGVCGKKDLKEAEKWLREAAKQGHENAMNKLKELGE